MAFQAKFTARRGKPNRGEVLLTAGSAEAQTDTISLNLDVTNMSRGDALLMVDAIKTAIIGAKWPPL